MNTTKTGGRSARSDVPLHVGPGHAAARPLGGPRRLRIAVAEDSAEMRALIAATLRADGCDVVEARDGLELVAIVAPAERSGMAFDLIVSDLRMPERSGMEALGALRDEGVRTPYLLITAFGDDETHRDARQLGAVAVLDKPFDLDWLCALVRAAVEPPRG